MTAVIASASAAAGALVLATGVRIRPRLVARPRAVAGTDLTAVRRFPRAVPWATVASVLAALSVTVLLGGFAGAVVVATAVVLRRVRPIAAARRARREAHRQFPEAVERAVLLIHAGLSPHLAVREASRSVPVAVRPAFEEVVHRLDRGVPLSDALTALPDMLGPHAATVADAFGAADRYGLPLEPLLDQLARDARAERRRLDEADARRLPVRLTVPLVTCTLPSFVLIAIAPAVLAAFSSLAGTSW